MEHSAGSSPNSQNGVSTNSKMEVNRPLAYRQPHIWGDHFLNYTPPSLDTQLQRKHELNELKEKVRKKLLTKNDNRKEKIIYIDSIEQLGVARYFEEEIETILQEFYEENCESDYLYENDLHYVSLRFRILRQHGYFVSCGVFEKFKNEDGNFKESISRHVEGILNLYEASYLRGHREKILDEAMQFTKSQLQSFLGKLSEPLATQVSRALTLPIHKCIPRLLSRYYIDTYESNSSHDKTLLRFAKIDFRFLQSLHLKELQDLSRSGKSLDLSRKLPFARNKDVEAYFWALATFYEPQYTLGRAMFTKVAKILTIMDDTYDAYGLYDELELYTEAVLRWDKSCMNKLPDYMKLTYENLLDTFDGFEQDLAKEARSHLVSFVRELVKAQCQAYFQEAKWLHENYVPNYDEYMEGAAITSAGYTVFSAVAFLDMGKIATEEAFEWVSQTPKVVKASCIISRLMNDIASHKAEQKRNHVVSAVECFMVQNDVSEEIAIEQLHKKVEEAWMDLNEEFFRPTTFPRPLLTIILNLARVIEFYYGLGDDGYSVVNQNTRDKIQRVLIDPILT